MNIAVLSTSDEGFSAVAALTEPVLSEYCKRHGYALGIDLNPRCKSILWHRYSMLKSAMGKYDWLLWMDADVLITNPEITLEEIIAHAGGQDIMVAKDQNGINDGVMFMRCSDWSENFIKSIMTLKDSANCNLHAFHMLYEANEHIRDMVSVKDQRMFNSYLQSEYGLPMGSPGDWQKGDFALHLPGMTPQRRVEIFQQVTEQTELW